MDPDECTFRAESCRRVAAALRDPEVIAELHALAIYYDDLAARLRRLSETEPGPPEPDEKDGGR